MFGKCYQFNLLVQQVVTHMQTNIYKHTTRSDAFRDPLVIQGQSHLRMLRSLPDRRKKILTHAVTATIEISLEYSRSLIQQF